MYTQIKCRDKIPYQIKHYDSIKQVFSFDVVDFFKKDIKIRMILIKLILIIAMVANHTFAGIDIPRDNCKWLDAHHGVEIKCDGNEVAVGACG